MYLQCWSNVTVFYFENSLKLNQFFIFILRQFQWTLVGFDMLLARAEVAVLPHSPQRRCLCGPQTAPVPCSRRETWAWCCPAAWTAVWTRRRSVRVSASWTSERVCCWYSHFRNRDELGLHVAAGLSALHVHGLLTWRQEGKTWVLCSEREAGPIGWELTLWRFGVVFSKSLVFGDVGVEEAQRVLWDVLGRHHLVGADDVGQGNGGQLLLGVRLDGVEDGLVWEQRGPRMNMMGRITFKRKNSKVWINRWFWVVL